MEIKEQQINKKRDKRLRIKTANQLGHERIWEVEVASIRVEMAAMVVSEMDKETIECEKLMKNT